MRCVGGLANASPHQLVRLSLTRAAGQPEGYGHLALITYDERGWWEHNGVAAQVSEPFAPVEAAVRLHELAAVLKANSGPLGAMEPEIEFLARGVVVDGSTVTAAADDSLVPSLPKVSMPVDEFSIPGEVNVRASALSIETQVGRIGLSLDLVRHFVERGITYGRVVETVSAAGTSEEAPYVSAETTVPVRGPLAPIVLGEVDVLRQGESTLGGDGPVLEERRDARGDEVAQLLMATSPTTPANDLLRLFDVGVGYVRRRVAAHARLPVQVINTISREGTEALRASAASNPSLPEEAAQRLHQDESPLVRAALACNRATPEILLARLGSDAVPQVRAGAAGNPRTPIGLLETLAGDVDPIVRQGAGGNVALPPKTLRRLAGDEDESVCAAVAGNPRCPADMLQELGHVLPQHVLGNPSAPARLLAAGAMASDPELRLKVARNRATSAEVLKKLASDPDDRVLAALLEHKSTPRRVRRQIEEKLDRRGPTEAPSAPLEETRGFVPRPGDRATSPVATTNGHALHDPAA